MSVKVRAPRQTKSHHPRTDPYKPMRPEAIFFIALVAFFLPVFLIYGFWSSWEPVGSTVLLLCVGLWGLTGFYLMLVSRRIDPRPEDNPVAEVAEGAGEYGTFSPWSWWPLVIGLGVTFAFLGAAAGWWLTGIGFVIGLGGLVGHVLEYSRGPHAH
ncbi:cytochrome c oxidase subunit 4 [Ruania zhangjianzhongii]|uniref:cytochrome c oxidase subunit 4 n=1 Tax=Ruania zhangjianzhongii TaxID=2603206 RepID=UPI002E252F07